jgi:hypothetical protein
MLRRKFAEEVSVSARAFECPRCEAVIYEDEFTLGKFVPPQFKHLDEAPLVVTSPGTGAFSRQEGQPALGENEVT